MLQRIKDKLNQPFPFYFNTQRGNFILLLAIVAFVAIFMYFFEPRGNEPAYNEFVQIFGYSLITAIVLACGHFLAPLMWTHFFDIERFTFGKYLLVNIVLIEIVTLLIHPFNQFVVWPDTDYCSACLLYDHRTTYLVAFIILLPASYMIKAWVLSQNLQLAQETNEGLLRQKKEKPHALSNKVVIATDTSETLALLPEDFLYAEAQDNYVQIYWRRENDTQSKMLRLSISRLEEQLTVPNIVRTHRSYMVNLEKVSQVKGNSNGLRLALEGQEFEVPVSRLHAQAIRDRLPENGR